jgi:hypothetical protein
MHTGTLWKLDHNKDATKKASWKLRDMWVSNNGSLCYYSQLENKRLVLLDSHTLFGAEIVPKAECAHEHAWQIKTHREDKEFIFAAQTAEENEKWLHFLRMSIECDGVPSMKLGDSVQQHLTAHRLSVRNRRLKIKREKTPAEYDAVFKAKIFKVKAAGDRMHAKDWVEREAWFSRNGSLVYYSQREKHELLYYTRADVERATIVKIENEASFKPWAWEVRLQAADGLEFAPGEFAAESEAMRDQWIAEFAKVGALSEGPEEDTNNAPWLACCLDRKAGKPAGWPSPR